MVYQKIVTYIKSQINDPIITLGDVLPTEAELAVYYSVSRGTIRKALNVLEEEGLVERRHGSGTYVKKKVVQTVTDRLGVYGFTKILVECARMPSSKVLKFEVLKATHLISNMLQVELGSLVYFAIRLRLDNDIPLQVEETWMSVEKFPHLTYSDLKGSKYNFIEEKCGIKIKGVYQSITPSLISDEYSNILMLSAKEPILMMTTQAIDVADVPIDYSILYTNPFNYQIKYYFSGPGL